MGENCERGTGSWSGRTVVVGNCLVRIVRDEQGADLGGQWLGGTGVCELSERNRKLAWADSVWAELLGENCERGTGSWLGRTVFGGNWLVRIVREEQGTGLLGQCLGGTGGLEL